MRIWNLSQILKSLKQVQKRSEEIHFVQRFGPVPRKMVAFILPPARRKTKIGDLVKLGKEGNLWKIRIRNRRNERNL